MEKIDVVIVGGGPAGISAALWCKRLELNHVLIESNTQLGGQLFQIHNPIIDYPGVFAKDGGEMQQLLSRQIETMTCNVKLNCLITSIDCKNNKMIYSEKSREKVLRYKFLILATGSKPNTLNINGEKEMLERGEIYSATRDKKKFEKKKVAVIGGGDRAFEGAYLFAKEGATVYLIHRSNFFRASVKYQQRVFENKHIKILENTSVVAIHGKKKVESIDIVQENKKQNLEIDAVIVRIGVKPNSLLCSHQIDVDKDGYIFVNQVGQTSIKTVFAIGDVCTAPKYSSISTSVGQAMISVKQISELLKADS